MLIQSILCPVDFSEFSVRAYSHALSLAEHYKSKLVALHVVELWRYPYADYAASSGDYAAFRHSLHKGGKQQLHEFVNKYSVDAFASELAICEGRAPDSILAFAEKEKIDLIVMGTHGRRGFDRLMLGSATDRVMRESSCPVLAVSQPTDDSIAAAAGKHHVHLLRRILACTDFSENSERALAYAISAADEYNAELTILHVMDKVSSPDRNEEAIATLKKQVDTLVPKEKMGALKIKADVRSGKPYQRIVEYAEEAHIDLVAMGVRGAGALDRAVFGSTTYRVIQLGPSPVLAVQI